MFFIEIQAGTREADHRDTVFQDDHIAKMPHAIGGEAYDLERKLKKVGQA